MKDADIIQELQKKLAIPVGRHLYGVLGTYQSLDRFSEKLQQATIPKDKPFPEPLSVNQGILETIPDGDFYCLVEDEPKRPETTTSYVARAFESFLRSKLREQGLIILKNIELLFAYNIELNLLRTLATDESRVLLLLPGIWVRGDIVMFPRFTEDTYTLPSNLIAENHLWELSD
jgi:hypothetical protein